MRATKNKKKKRSKQINEFEDEERHQTSQKPEELIEEKKTSEGEKKMN